MGEKLGAKALKAKAIMTEAEINKIVRQALSHVAPEVDLDRIDPTKDLRDQIDIDSVDFLNFVIGLHKELNVDIPDGDVSKLATLKGCAAYLAAKPTGR
ncbi:MAG TPA: acyl carrier protein [Candidatus Binatia bacterium]|nr:acyl carrier protein [Candidatus Binatia bacterium]